MADAVKRLKGASPYYINEQDLLKEKFVWQRGYGVLTVGERHLEIEVGYVERQKAHHQQQTTNYWLEHMNVEDEGPEDPGITPNTIPHRIREPKATYETDDPFPF